MNTRYTDKEWRPKTPGQWAMLAGGVIMFAGYVWLSMNGKISSFMHYL